MSKPVHTHVVEHDDGKFVRTALVAEVGNADGGSVAIVDTDGNRVALVNLFLYENGNLIVDVIDVDGRYDRRSALTFRDGMRRTLDADKVISADFRSRKLPLDRDGRELAWPAPSGGYVDAWNGWYEDRDAALRESRTWTASIDERTRAYGEDLA